MYESWWWAGKTSNSASRRRRAVDHPRGGCDTGEMPNPESAGTPCLRVLIRQAFPTILLVCVVLTSFLNKAFLVDGTLFLHAAGQVLRDPLHPTAFTVVWDLDVPIRASSGIFVSGPVTAFLLAPPVFLGGVEWVAYLVQLGLVCLGITATVGLALRLGFSERAKPCSPAAGSERSAPELSSWRKSRRLHSASRRRDQPRRDSLPRAAASTASTMRSCAPQRQTWFWRRSRMTPAVKMRFVSIRATAPRIMLGVQKPH
jgi:hypothetical protein